MDVSHEEQKEVSKVDPEYGISEKEQLVQHINIFGSEIKLVKNKFLRQNFFKQEETKMDQKCWVTEQVMAKGSKQLKCIFC